MANEPIARLDLAVVILAGLIIADVALEVLRIWRKR